jgi:arylsulfatase A-like enzyme
VRKGIPLLAGLLLLVGAGVAAWNLRPRGAPPHVVVFLWDTTRADRLSAYGYARDTTPWLERIAAEGVLYEQCRAPAPWTVPSHASLFTGLLPSHHGCLDLARRLAEVHETLAERLRARGYDTILISNNDFVGSDEVGLGQGFDRIVMVMKETGEPPSVRNTLVLLDRELRARRGDAARAAKPLFLFVNLMEPHLPYTPTPSFERAWRPGGATESEVNGMRSFMWPADVLHNMGVPGEVLDAKRVGILKALYDAEIRDLDAGSADLEKRLVEEGILGPGADALFVVTSDHGESLGEHGLLDHKFSSGDWLLRVPLVMRRPGRREGGRRVAEQVRLQDLFPTILDAAGARYDPAAIPDARPIPAAGADDRVAVSWFPPPLSFEEQARSALPPDVPPRCYEPFRVGHLTATDALRDGRRLKWERRWTVDASGRNPQARPATLFDLEADPGEAVDLLAGGGDAERAAAERLRGIAEAATAPR